MIKISIDSESRKVLVNLKSLGRLTKVGIQRAFYYIGHDLQKTSRKLIDKKPKSGRLYIINVGGVTLLHRASAPGEAPASITYRLRNSIGYRIQGANSLIFGSRRSTYMLQSGAGKRLSIVNYPKDLELGNSKIAPRPYLRPAIEGNYRNIEFYFANEVAKATATRLLL